MQENTENCHFNLLLLPGMDGTGDLFEPFLSKLPDWITPTVIRYPLNRKLTYDELVVFVTAQLPKKEFVLLAESFSGPIASRLIQQKDSKVSHLILLATFFSNPNPGLLNWVKHLPIASLLRLPLPNWLVRYFCFEKNVNAHLIDLFKLAITKVSPSVMSHRIHEMAALPKSFVERFDSEGISTEKKITCLNLISTRDRMLAKQSIDELRTALSLFSFLSVTHCPIDAPHFILQTRPQESVEILTKFLNAQSIPTSKRN